MTDAPILAIDLGSSSLRVARFADDATVVVSSQRHYPFRDAGLRGVPPLEWAALLADALEEVGGAGADRVVVSALWHSVLGVDADDEPVTEVLTWESPGPDAEIPALAARVDPESYRARTGSYLHSSYPLAGILHLRASGASPARWTDGPSWLLRRVLGVGPEVGWSSQIAAGSGLWHQVADDWDGESLELADVEGSQLGSVWREPVRLGAGTPFGLAGALLLPVLGDGYCDSIGIDAVGPDVSALTAATSGSLRMVLDGVLDDAPAGIWRYRVGPQRTALGGAISNAGNLLAWVRGNLAVDDPLSFASSEEPPPSDGLVALPEFAGERGPRYRRGVSGAVAGMRTSHTGADVARELVLGACAIYGTMTDLMAVARPELARLITAGGIVRAAPIFGQLLADSTGRRVSLSGVRESSLRGAAVDALGSAPQPPVLDEFTPRPAWQEAFRQRRADMAELDARLRGPR